MLCKFCKNTVSGKYCSNCGKKNLDNFSKENFTILFNYVFDNREKYLSQKFQAFLEKYPFGFFPSATRLFHIMLLTGYLIRITEEEFGSVAKIRDSEIEATLNQPDLKEIEKIEKIVNYIDAKCSMISLDGVSKEILIFPKIIDLFNSIIEQRFISFFEQAKKEGEKLSKKFDLETAHEIAFRNAVYGYLYRTVEKFYFHD